MVLRLSDDGTLIEVERYRADRKVHAQGIVGYTTDVQRSKAEDIYRTTEKQLEKQLKKQLKEKSKK